MAKITSSQHQILEFFKKLPGQRFYLRELARKLNLDPGNLSREINKLVKSKALIKKSEGSLVYFSLNLEKDGDFDPSYLLNSSKVEKYLENAEKDLISLTQSLIRIPSVSGKNPEEEIAQYIFDKAKRFGLKPQIVAKDRRRPNLVIETGQHRDSLNPNFLLLGHLDTVGVEEIDSWRYYPFSGHKAGGHIYGRGAADMKAGIACELFTLKTIHDLNIELPVNPRLILVSNEEGGSTSAHIFEQGMEYVIAEGFVKGVAAIYGYGGSYNIGIGHRGVLRVKITTHGKEVHTGSVKWQRKEKGKNAVTGMAEILLALENMKIPKTTHPSFPRHGNVVTPGTMILHGGTEVSMVPEYCESVVEVRYLPGLEIKKVYHEIKEIAEKIAEDRGIKVELERFVNVPAFSLSPSEEIIKTTSCACEQVYGRKITSRGYGPANESYMLVRKGIPTIVFGPLGGGAHSDNEFISVKSLVKTIKVYLLTMMTCV